MLAWGNAPGCKSLRKQALKTRLNGLGNESRFQRWAVFTSRTLGRCPRLEMNIAPLALIMFYNIRVIRVIRSS
jgi:hypothetical protein